MPKRLIATLLLAIFPWPALAQQQPPPVSDRPADTTGQPEKASDAERISRLQRAITDGEQQLGALLNRFNDPESSYVKAKAAFQELDAKYEETKKSLETLRLQSDDMMTEAARQDLLTIEKQWLLAKERFDLAIEERRVSSDQFNAIEQKLRGDVDALAKLTTAVEAPSLMRSSEAGNDPQSGVQAHGALPMQPAETGTVPPSVVTNGAPAPIQPAHPLVAPILISPQGAAMPPQAAPAPEPSAEVKQAQQEAAAKEQEAKQAEEETRSIEDRIASLSESIEAERKLLDVARQKVDNAIKTKNTLNEELHRRWAANATWADLKDLRTEIEEQEKLNEAARTEGTVRTDRLVSLQSHLSELQGERIAAMQEADEKRADADRARVTLADLENPFSPENLLNWLVKHGPKIIGIIVVMFLLLLIARVLESRLVPILAKHGHGRGGASVEDRENRAKTLMSVFHNTARVVVIIGGSLMLLAEVGLNILPIMTAAGIAGLAIAFGAQNLIRDYFYGFTILIENQYMVNDVVRIAGISGMVERITLRITVLRDIEGIVHFVPHGEVKTVSNLTHGWSRVLFEIGVSYKEDTDRVMKVLTDLGKEIRRDPEYSALILDDPEMLGVDQLGDSAVVIKFLIKTRPLKQWTVKREMLRRIKNKFDELSIDIPFPSRTIYHHYVDENGEGDPRPPRLGKTAFAKSYADGE